MEIIVRHLEHDAREYSNSNLNEKHNYHDEVLQLDQDGNLLSAMGSPKGNIDKILFITGNQNKVNELEQSLNCEHVKLSNFKIDLPEIQGSNILDIVQDKCKRAFEHINKLQQKQCSQTNSRTSVDRPTDNHQVILIEDTSLNFRALNGMPGPYVKWFLEAVGCVGLHRMLAGFEDKCAEAVCVYALMENPRKIVFFKGIARGKITEPRGSSWGWDAIFEEETTRKTFGELDASTKSKLSHRANAVAILQKYLCL